MDIKKLKNAINILRIKIDTVDKEIADHAQEFDRLQFEFVSLTHEHLFKQLNLAIIKQSEDEILKWLGRYHQYFDRNISVIQNHIKDLILINEGLNTPLSDCHENKEFGVDDEG